MEIQKIFAEINENWGNEHEEKLKNIFQENIIRNPIIAFWTVSIPFLSVSVCLFIFGSYVSTREIKESSVEISRLFFNFPYYLFDLRSSIILSISSILLSLYVSVGKFADGYEGVLADARRAAYRKFVKCVGYIIFTAFVLNFWHGLLAGYFRSGSIPLGWLNSLKFEQMVPSDVNLSRYGDMPLWSLLFFAWFTLGTSLMLTYNEKDILIRSVYTLQKLKNINNFQKSQYIREYNLAKRELESSGIDSPPWSSEYRITKYGDLFSRNIRSDDFKFKFMGKRYWSKSVTRSFWLPIVLDAVFIIVLLFCFQEKGQLLSVLIFIFELIGWIFVFSGLRFYPSILSVDSTGVSSKSGSFVVKQIGFIIVRFGDIFYAAVIFASLLSVLQGEVDKRIVLIVLASFLSGVTFREIVVYNFRQLIKYNSKILLIYKYFGVLDSSLSDEDIFIPGFGILESFKFVLQDVWVKCSSIPWVGNILSKLHGGKTPPNPYVKKGEVDYIALAYIYFIMIRAVEYYMDYESEIGGKKPGEKEKQGCEDAQAPNSDIQEESQTTYSQG